MRRGLILISLAAVAGAPGESIAHELDHPAPAPMAAAAPQQTAASGPAQAKWEFVGSVATGNPHTDIDFFTRGGETYASVGTLAIGPNGGGQTIVQLTDRGRISPRYVGLAPTAFCPSSPASTTALQHDAEASPKGAIDVLNSFNPFADRRDAQVIIDATDGPGRCHDQGTLGLVGAPQGGLEIVDVTDPPHPVTIGMTSHIGQAHTVNVDPKRPHIAYAVTADTVSVSSGRRENEIAGDNDQLDLDGFEVVDMRSCLNFPAGTSLQAKRTSCRPQVYRYRWPSLAMAEGHTDKSVVFGCHELEVYPNDRLTCANGTSLIVLDMSQVFDDNGTPEDFTDDRPRGTPLPCGLRPSSSAGPFRIAEPLQVVDCVHGGADGTVDLSVPGWLAAGAPSLDGVRYVGTVHHEGGHPSTATDPQHVYPSGEDIAFDHEAELSASGNLLIATDERGGGVTPPGASCSQGADNPDGNGGVHFFRVDRLRQNAVPAKAEDAWRAYARTPAGKKAIYRAPVRTGVQGTVCTSHVFQQIPGQNRIFMGWYSQGTQVVDFEERPDGTVALKEAGYFIPVDTNEWVSHIFRAQENADGTFTYYGATGDFNLGERGRNAIDVYRVTLPAPPLPADGPGVVPRGTKVTDASGAGEQAVTPRSGAPACVASSGLSGVRVAPRGGGLSLAARGSGLRIDLFQQSRGRRVVGERLVARLRRSGTVARSLSDGYYIARFRARAPDGQLEVRRFALRRVRGRFTSAPAYAQRERCGRVRAFKLERPVFARTLRFAVRFGADERASVVVRNARGRVVRRYAARTFRGGRLYRTRLRVPARFGRGTYAVSVRGNGFTATLRARRL